MLRCYRKLQCERLLLLPWRVTVSEYKMAAITVHASEKNCRKQTIHLAMQMAEFIRSLFRSQFVWKCVK